VTQQFGVGLIGYGLGGRAFHAPYIATTPGLSLRAIVSRDSAKVHADWPDATVVPDVAALLALLGIDLVVVSSPDALHADHACAALSAGKHVVVDKPFATTLDDAKRISTVAARSGTLLAVFHNRRWDADFRTLQRLMSDGMLGEIVQVESRFDRWRPVPAAVWKEERSGGSWMDLGPHLVDQALCLFGMPQSVSADLATLRPAAMAPDYFQVALHYPQRRVLLQSSKLVANHGLRFAVHGTRGSWVKHGLDLQEAATIAGRLPIGGDWGVDPSLGTFQSGDQAAAPVLVPNEPGDYRCFWQTLVAALRGEAANPVPAAQALAVMEVLDAGLRSATEQRVIDIG
jgi:predicted dehydrogenase